MRTIALVLCFVAAQLYSQSPLPPGTYTSTNKKAIKFFLEGRKYYEMRKETEAEKNLNKATELDPNFVEAWMTLGYLYADVRKLDKGIACFKKATEINPKFFPNNFYDLAALYFNTGNYSEAATSYETFLSFQRINPNLKEKAEKYLKDAKFGTEQVKNPKPFDPKNLGAGVNSSEYEYFPTITADGQTFIFTRNFRSEGGAGQEDFYLSRKKDGIWQSAMPVLGINSQGNEGAPSISADGQYMFMAMCADMFGNYGKQGRKGFGSCDLFFSQKVNGKWSEPVNCGQPINSGNWETQPSISSDGKTLYFIRGMVTREGIKQQDIYYSEIGTDGRFSEPVKLGPNVNTDGREESVYIHPDNMTLYFSSDGRVGMGGLDLYMSKRQPDGNWGEAINLGYPINTWNDENSLLVDPSGELAYFASDRAGGFGGLDIYQFVLPKEYRPEAITYVKGKVFDAKTANPLEANFELFDLESGKQMVKAFSGKDGNFLVTLTANKNYLLNVSKDGYLYYSDNFSLKDIQTDFKHPFQLDVPLQPIDTGMVVELKNIFFDVNKHELKPESNPELQKLIEFLQKNPKLKIELGGHTDNSGDKKFNQTLSQNRAKAVYDYVLSHSSIDKNRLAYKGYGDTKPKVPNDSPENKAKNRRTEFRVLVR